jgi:peptidoglycan/LPS O-acetylase OafA/YrhL
MFMVGIEHPTVYVTPIFRPESVFLGLLLAASQPRWHWSFSLIAVVAGIAAIVSLPRSWESHFAAVAQYPLIAIMSAAVLDATIRCPALRGFAGWKPFVALGAASYGLYVFHYFARYVIRGIGDQFGLPQTGTVGSILSSREAFSCWRWPYRWSATICSKGHSFG